MAKHHRIEAALMDAILDLPTQDSIKNYRISRGYMKPKHLAKPTMATYVKEHETGEVPLWTVVRFDPRFMNYAR